MSRKREEDELDTQTTFADMNVEGFRWYEPNAKKGKQKERVTRKEYWQMVKGAFLAYLPVIGIIVLIALLMFTLGYLWLM